MINLQVPIDEKTVRSLRVGDQVSLSGAVLTARDRAQEPPLPGGSLDADVGLRDDDGHRGPRTHAQS